MAMAVRFSREVKYDVFLSFKGLDTCKGFVDCLNEFLSNAGLHVFMFNKSLNSGESIERATKEAIYGSRLFLPIFTGGYVSSNWCLKEIAWMTDCMEEFPGKTDMLPVFYDLDASDVRLRTDLYTKALTKHEETSSHETVERWRKALIKVPSHNAWNLADACGKGQFIDGVTEHVIHRLTRKHRILPYQLIGTEEQAHDIMATLECGSRDVRIVVIHGMGGIGKTTLASFIFNKMCDIFQGCSFLYSARESSALNGILNLQKKLLLNVLSFSGDDFLDANDAMNYIKGSLRNKDVLVVLDDVSHMDQIRKLIGMGEWLGLGSRVIITTRDLSCVPAVNEIVNNTLIFKREKIYIYSMRELGLDKSRQLLCLTKS